MSVFNTVTGTIGLGLFAVLTAGVVLPPMPPIVVHSLAYENGEIIQDRTVTVANENTFFAYWEAEIVNAATGEIIKDCHGSGSWDYQGGRRAVRMTPARWTGNPACTVADLPPEFYLRAIWRWGDSGTTRESAVFSPD